MTTGLVDLLVIAGYMTGVVAFGLWIGSQGGQDAVLAEVDALDALGRSVDTAPAQRVVSLVPSET